MSSKDARRAVMIAARMGRAEGGKIPLLGDPVQERLSHGPNGPMRSWVPPLPEDGGAAPTVPPVYRSLTHDTLADPDSLGGMKQGNPQQWMNALTKAGAKKEELEWLGVGEGHPNVKTPRAEVLARAKARLPKIGEKVLGEQNKERVLISGSEDEDQDPDYDNTRVVMGDWAIDDPDDNYLYDRARERLEDDIDEKTADPDEVEEHLPDILDKYADKWLRAGTGNTKGSAAPGDNLRPERIAAFAGEAVQNGWALPEKASALLDHLEKKGRVDDKTWNAFVDHTVGGFSDTFNKVHKLEEEQPLLFQHQDMEPAVSKEPTDTEEYLAPFNKAVLRLHGLAVNDDKLPVKGDGPVLPKSALADRDYRRANPTPDLYDDLQEHVKEKLQEEYEQHERDQYYEDEESPQTATAKLEGFEEDPDYTVHSGYGEYSVHAPNGNRIATTHSQEEAEQAIMNHAIDNYTVSGGGSGSTAKYEERDVPQGNIETPQSEGRARYQSYALPGMINYREVPISFEPKPGDPDFTRSHYDPNTLGHMRVGEVRDEDDHRLLHIDEIQSDWHQKGNDEGYLTGDAAQKQAEAKAQLPDVEKELLKHRALIAAGLGFKGEANSVIDKYAAYMLLDPNNLRSHETSSVLNSANYLDPDHASEIFGDDFQHKKAPELVQELQNTAASKWGPNFRGVAMGLNNAAQKQRDLNEVLSGRYIPDAPWKDSGDFGRLAIRRALRMAADYGYDGISLSPGWVQNDRWAGQDHKHLYDNIFRGSMDGVASEANRFAKTDLRREEVKIPVLSSQAKSRGVGDGLTGKANVLLFHKPENVTKLRQNSLPLFKRGGAASAKDARRAVLIAKTYAAGGAVPMPAPDDGETPLMVVHNTRPDRLQMADQIGGLAVPSLGIISPKHGFKSFGNVTLIGQPDMAVPSRQNPIFASDVYSPTFPSLNEDKTKIFKGYTNNGNRSYSPLTMENLVKSMKGNVRGGEKWNYGAGTVRAGITPQFKNMNQIKASRDRIVPGSQFDSLKKRTNEELLELADQFHPHSAYEGSPVDHAFSFANLMLDAAKKGTRTLNEHYKNLPPELTAKAQDYLHRLRDMETEYFEAKPQRAVNLNEFVGAVIPQSERHALVPLLQKHGINKIVTYGRTAQSRDDHQEDRRKALYQFPEAMFKYGGTVYKPKD